MRKEDKSVIVEQISALLQQYPHFYLVDIEGMDAETTSAMRRKCFQSNVKMVAVKNTLLKKALDANEVDFSEMYGVLKGHPRRTGRSSGCRSGSCRKRVPAWRDRRSGHCRGGRTP